MQETADINGCSMESVSLLHLDLLLMISCLYSLNMAHDTEHQSKTKDFRLGGD